MESEKSPTVATETTKQSWISKVITAVKNKLKKKTEPEEQENDKELVQKIAIKDTPFTAVKVNDGWFLTMGKYRLTDKLKTLAETKENAKDVSWFRVMQIMNICIIEHEMTKQLEQTIEKQKAANKTEIFENLENAKQNLGNEIQKFGEKLNNSRLKPTLK